MSLKAAFETGEDDATLDFASTDAQWKRIASTVIGGGLVAIGLKKRSVSGSVATIAGGWLLYRGLTGTQRTASKRETSVVSDSGDAIETEVDSEAGIDSDTDIDADMTPDRVPDTATGGGSSSIVARIRSKMNTDPPRVERSITVGKSPEELYELWLEPGTLEQLMGQEDGMVAVNADDGRWEWTVSGPLEGLLTWETELVEKEPNESLRWESVDGEFVSVDGEVEFRRAPADRGTEVTLRLEVDHPGGSLGNGVLNGIGIVPRMLESKALNRFKSLAETGEIPSLETNPSGRGTGDLV